MNRFFKTVALLLSQLLYSVFLYLTAFCVSSMLVLWTIIVCKHIGMDVASVRLLRCALCGAVPIWFVFEVSIWIRVARQLRIERNAQEASQAARKLDLSKADETEEKSEEEILAEEALFPDGADGATEEPQEAQ